MYLTVFRNRKRADINAADYSGDADAMEALARQQPGFLSFKSYTADDGEVVSVSEWTDRAAAKAWGRHPEHARIQSRGKAEYYESYTSYGCSDPSERRFQRLPA